MSEKLIQERVELDFRFGKMGQPYRVKPFLSTPGWCVTSGTARIRLAFYPEKGIQVFHT